MSRKPDTKAQPIDKDLTWWEKNRKKILIIGGTAVLVAVGSYFGIKYRSELANLSRAALGAVKKRLGAVKLPSKNRLAAPPSARKTVDIRDVSKQAIQILPTTIEAVNATPVLPDHFLDNITGERRPPRGIGELLDVSAQEVNKRLLEKGLQRPFGNKYEPTEIAKKLGAEVWKTTSHDFVFSNIEWDIIVAELIAKPEELPRLHTQFEFCRQIA